MSVIRQVDQQLDAAFADFQKLPLRTLTFVLFGAALALATLDHHTTLVDVQRLRNGCQRIEQSGRGFFRIDGLGRGVFLNVHPVVVQVDRQRILGHVGIVDAVAVDAFTAHPLAHQLEVLLQAVGKHLPAFAQARLLDHHRFRLDRVAVLVEFTFHHLGFDRVLTLDLTLLGVRRSPVTNWSGVTLISNNLHGKAPFQNEYCLWLRMPMRLPRSGAPVNTAASQLRHA